MLPSPPLSPPNAEGSDKQESVEAKGINPNSETANLYALSQQCLPLVSSQAGDSSIPPVETVSSTVEGCLDQEKTSDSEMDAVRHFLQVIFSRLLTNFAGQRFGWIRQ